MTSVMRRERSLLDALGQADDRARVGPMYGRASAEHRAQPVRRHAEHDHVGAGARLLERRGRAQRVGQARCRAGSRGSRGRSSICAASSARRAHNMVGALPATIAATAVPHDPAPTTATRVTPVLRCAPAVSGIAPPPRVVARRRALRVDLARARDALDDRVHDPIGRRRFTCSSGSSDDRLADHRDLRRRPTASAACGPSSGSGACPTAHRRDRRRRPRCASRAVPDLPAIGSRSCEIVPSGNTPTHSPRCERVDRGVERVGRVGPARAAPGIWCAARSSGPSPGLSNSSALARNRTCRPRRSATYASVSGSRYETWLLARITGPGVGMWSAPSIVQRKPYRNQGENTPFATEYTGSTLGSIRRPCRPGAFPTPRASSSRCGRSRWARRGSRTRSTTTRAEALARTMAERVVAAAGTATGRDRLERARSRSRGRARSVSHVVDDPGSLDARRRRGPRVGARPRPRRASSSCTPTFRSRRRSTRSPTTAPRRSR